MTTQKHSQFSLYEAEAAIPRYQRAWVWGTAALVILLCGVVAGGLFGRLFAADPGVPLGNGTMNGATSLTEQEAVNQQLRERIATLEQVLAGDVCDPAAMEVLPPDVGK